MNLSIAEIAEPKTTMFFVGDHIIMTGLWGANEKYNGRKGTIIGLKKERCNGACPGHQMVAVHFDDGSDNHWGGGCDFYCSPPYVRLADNVDNFGYKGD